MKKVLKKITGLILGTGLIYILILMYPHLLFANQYHYKNYHIYSDKAIQKEIKMVIDDAISRIEVSELYDPNFRFKVFLCNDNWRFKFFTRNGNAGGVVNYLISDNIFVRENNVKTNQLIPPKTWRNPLIDRPLSYFIAHESIHSLQREYDKFLIFKTPMEIIEGYAEYIAKKKTNDTTALIQAYKNNAPNMNPKNGLYDKYNLYIAYLIEQKGYDFERIMQEQPNIDVSLTELIANE